MPMTTTTGTNWSKSEIDVLFDGLIQPCDQAYLDYILDDEEHIDLQQVSVSSRQRQSLTPEGEGKVVFSHTVLYKRSPIWKLKIDTSTLPQCQGKYLTACELRKGRIEVSIDSNDRRWFQTKSTFSESRLFDVASLVRGAAVAYQMIAAEEEMKFENEALNSYAVEESDINDGSDNASRAESQNARSVEGDRSVSGNSHKSWSEVSRRSRQSSKKSSIKSKHDTIPAGDNKSVSSASRKSRKSHVSSGSRNADVRDDIEPISDKQEANDSLRERISVEKRSVSGSKKSRNSASARSRRSRSRSRSRRDERVAEEINDRIVERVVGEEVYDEIDERVDDEVDVESRSILSRIEARNGETDILSAMSESIATEDVDEMSYWSGWSKKSQVSRVSTKTEGHIISAPSKQSRRRRKAQNDESSVGFMERLRMMNNGISFDTV